MLDIFVITAVAAKFVLYVALLTAVGSMLVSVLFDLQNLTRLVFWMVVTTLIASIVLYSIDAITLTGDFSGFVDMEILTLISETSNGQAFFVRLLGISLIFAGLFLNRIGKWLAVLGALIAVYSFTQVGHMSDKNSGLITISLFIHLIAASLWIGILFPLRKMALSEKDHNKTARIAHRFGQIASGFVPVLISVGVYMAWQLFDSFLSLVTSGYGQVFLAKIVAVSSLLGLAARNKLKFVPELRRGNIQAAKHLANTINYEWMVFIIVLLATALLTTASDLPS